MAAAAVHFAEIIILMAATLSAFGLRSLPLSPPTAELMPFHFFRRCSPPHYCFQLTVAAFDLRC